MSAMGSKLRKTTVGILHWCPACEEVHHFVTDGSRGWVFNGNVDAPTFTPSMKITWGKQADPNCDVDGGICHYILTDGMINYCGDCTHGMVGQSVPIPDWPYARGTYGGIEE